MSIEAMNWALDQKTGSAASKSVLLILSNRADHNGVCWPGISGICRQTELSRRAVIDNIKRLESDGFLTIEKRKQPLTNLYKLSMKGSAGGALVQEVHGAGDAPGSAGGALPVVQEVHQGSAGGAPEPSITINKPKVTQRSKSTLEGFDRFWLAYPKKVKKKTAREIWQRKKPNADVLIADIQNRLVNDARWKEGYVPDPTTYLNGERWDDEITKAAAPDSQRFKEL